MALIPCPECKTEISDKAAGCPKCGHPMGPPISQGNKKNFKLVGNTIAVLCLAAVLWWGWQYIQKATALPKPPMPVEVKYHKSLIFKGYVAVFLNDSNRQLTLLATFKNPTLDEKKNVQITLAPNSFQQYGKLEGWNFASGDIITLTHHDYATQQSVIP